MTGQATITARTWTGYDYEFFVDGKKYSGRWEKDAERDHHAGDRIPISYLQSNPADNNYGTTLRISPWDTPTNWWVFAALTGIMSYALARSDDW